MKAITRGFFWVFGLLFLPVCLISQTANRSVSLCGPSFSAGMTFSAVDFTKGDDALKKGANFRAVFPSGRFVRLSLETGFLFPYSYGETWKNVKAHDMEFNTQFVANVEGINAAFYALTGLFAKRWSAEYTGINKEVFFPVGNLQAGDKYSKIQMGANLGCGFEKKISEFGVFGDVKFRLAPDDLNVKIRIVDVAYTAGVKYYLNPACERKNKRKYFRMPKNIYDLD
jgi:hypothetical protein